MSCCLLPQSNFVSQTTNKLVLEQAYRVKYSCIYLDTIENKLMAFNYNERCEKLMIIFMGKGELTRFNECSSLSFEYIPQGSVCSSVLRGTVPHLKRNLRGWLGCRMVELDISVQLIVYMLPIVYIILWLEIRRWLMLRTNLLGREFRSTQSIRGICDFRIFSSPWTRFTTLGQRRE